MTGILLDPNTGQPAPPTLLGPSGIPAALEENIRRGWNVRGLGETPDLSCLPAHVVANLERARQTRSPFEARASMQSWEELIYATVADGTQVIASTAETIMVPDFTLPANYLYPGRVLRYTVFFDISTVVTTPGTIILSLRYGGVAGTVLAVSGAYAPDPTGASTNQSGWVEFVTVCRATGTAASSFTMGRMWLGDFDDASASTLQGNLNMFMIPATSPAAVNINTTTQNALSPTVKFSVTTATTQFTSHIAVLEAMS